MLYDEENKIKKTILMGNEGSGKINNNSIFHKPQEQLRQYLRVVEL